MSNKKDTGLEPGHKHGSRPGLPDNFDLAEYSKLSMTDWFSPAVLFAYMNNFI